MAGQASPSQLAAAKADKKKAASKNPEATTGAGATVNRIGVNEPHDNLPFAQWTTGAGGLASQIGSNYFGINEAMKLPQGLKRGRLRESHPHLRGDTQPLRLYFMFNPTEVSVSYGFNESVIPSAFAEPADLSVPLMANGSGIGFALLFDRTYEVWTGSPAVAQGRKGPGQIGTLWDIQALERLMGIYHDENGVPLGPPTMGQIVASFGAEGGKSLTFQGYLNSVSVTHATFDANMTPTRSRIDITMSQSFMPPQGATLSPGDSVKKQGSGGGRMLVE